METILAPEAWPFSVAVVLLLAIAVIEGMGLLFGLSVSGWIDHLPWDGAHGLGSVSETWLGWLHVGKVPMLVLLVLLLTSFAVIGYTCVALVNGMFGFYPPVLMSTVLAFVGALPIVRISATAIARIVPRDETSAVPLESLVGHIAVIVNGTARANYPAQARVRNAYGQTLYVHVEPDAPNLVFGTGESVLLVKQISGSRFLAIANPRPDLL